MISRLENNFVILLFIYAYIHWNEMMLRNENRIAEL